MDKTAIEELQKPASIHSMNGFLHGILESVVDGTTGFVPTVAVHKDFEIANLERFAPHPARFRGSFHTTALSQFGSYCHQYGNPETSICFVSSDDMSAKAIFDHGTADRPEHGEHAALVQLKPLADFKKFCGLDGRKLSQAEFVEVIEDFEGFMTFVSAEVDGKVTTLDPRKVLSAVRNVTVSEMKELNQITEDFATSRSSLSSTKLKTSENIPKHIDLMTVPYTDFEPIIIKTRLVIHITEDEVFFKIAFVNREKMEETNQLEFARMIGEHLSDKGGMQVIPLFSGQFSR